jgi:hypothetical protein
VKRLDKSLDLSKDPCNNFYEYSCSNYKGPGAFMEIQIQNLIHIHKQITDKEYMAQPNVNIKGIFGHLALGGNHCASLFLLASKTGERCRIILWEMHECQKGLGQRSWQGRKVGGQNGQFGKCPQCQIPAAAAEGAGE